MERGYIRLWRKSIDSDVFACPHLWKLWCWCLMRATYKSRAATIKTGRGSIIVQLSPGEFVFGRNSATETLQEPPSTIRNRIKKLESMGMILIKADSQYSIVSICNWEIYQAEESEIEQPKDNQRTTKGLAKDTDNKGKKEKNEKNILGPTQVPTHFPITDQMRQWVTASTSFQGSISTETEKFLDYWRAKGGMKKDWLAAWRNWMRKASEYQAASREKKQPGFSGTGKRMVV